MTVTITLPALHPAQLAIHDSAARFRVAACGARFGKNVVAATEQLQAGLHGCQSWHVAPDYPTSEIHWRLLKYLAGQLPGVNVREADKMVTFGPGGWIQVKSANSILRGEGLDLITVDEAAHIPGLLSIWQEQLRPRLTDRQGRALFISTPFGLNDFHDLYGYGLDPLQPDWQSFTFPTAANPFIPASEIEAARRSLPARIFEQEYLAIFQSDNTGVFRCVREVSILSPQVQPIEGHSYIMGVDWGRTDDYTCISIFDQTTRQQAALDRFTGIGWALQRERIKLLYERWRPGAIWAEANSIGQPNIEALQQEEGLPVHPFMTTATSKPGLIDGLALAIEKGAVGEQGGVLLVDDPIQRAELLSYGFQRTPNGTYRYSAPPGKHDDTVIALALSLHGASHGGFWVEVW